MSQNNKKISTSLLDTPIISRIRRNHGLEHATLHVLSQRVPGKVVAGHSNPGGFWILGQVDTDELRSAVDEALRRLRGGEASLAVHPNCGTNLVVSGAVTGAAVLLAMSGAGGKTRKQLERLPLATTAAAFALVASRPLGAYLQKHVTTSGTPGDLRVVDVIPAKKGKLQAHRVITRG